MADRIIIEDLEVRARIGVTAAERRKPQRLLITMEVLKSLASAGKTDDLRKTIDYDAVARRVRALGAHRTGTEELVGPVDQVHAHRSSLPRRSDSPKPGCAGA